MLHLLSSPADCVLSLRPPPRALSPPSQSTCLPPSRPSSRSRPRSLPSPTSRPRFPRSPESLPPSRLLLPSELPSPRASSRASTRHLIRPSRSPPPIRTSSFENHRSHFRLAVLPIVPPSPSPRDFSPVSTSLHARYDKRTSSPCCVAVCRGWIDPPRRSGQGARPVRHLHPPHRGKDRYRRSPRSLHPDLLLAGTSPIHLPCFELGRPKLTSPPSSITSLLAMTGPRVH